MLGARWAGTLCARIAASPPNPYGKICACTGLAAEPASPGARAGPACPHGTDCVWCGPGGGAAGGGGYTVWPAADSGAAAVEPAAEAEASTGRSAAPTEDKCASDNHAPATAVPWDGGGTVWAHGAAAVATGGGAGLAAGAAHARTPEVGGTVWAHGAAAVATGGGAELAAGAAHVPTHEVGGTWWAHGAAADASGGGAELPLRRPLGQVCCRHQLELARGSSLGRPRPAPAASSRVNRHWHGGGRRLNRHRLFYAHAEGSCRCRSSLAT